jgi:hypothetical protein
MSFRPLLELLKVLIKPLKIKIFRWFSSPTVFLDNDNNVFGWWVTKYIHYRRVALAAKFFLAIPGGFVPFERAFSTSG